MFDLCRSHVVPLRRLHGAFRLPGMAIALAVCVFGASPAQ